MKKHITLAIFFIFFASAATIFAQAQQSNANMNQMKMQQTNSTMNQDMSCCKKMMGNKMMMLNPLTDAQAKQLVTDYIKNNNLKGYSVVNIKKYNSHMGAIYRAEIKDSSNNLFTLILGHMGQVKGPFPTSVVQ